MTAPARIQRRRTKGWKMPENTVSVTRPGPYGNPFKFGDYVKFGGGFTYLITTQENATPDFTFIASPKMAVEFYAEYRRRFPLTETEKAFLRGKNLACWCAVGSPCHADALLELANRP